MDSVCYIPYTFLFGTNCLPSSIHVAIRLKLAFPTLQKGILSPKIARTGEAPYLASVLCQVGYQAVQSCAQNYSMQPCLARVSPKPICRALLLCQLNISSALTPIKQCEAAPTGQKQEQHLAVAPQVARSCLRHTAA